ncbi:TetR/AcrR family transcriptional regulator [Kineosporia sp. A_224]|uniref:TetR/AcrR family transcriptional regulator n=1 Tax=Kineosporia sp. A_224 TaxID=1962180 RepID=UPI000B4BB676|nr:TetR family transcriptional regulator C-terminal domain-containing protein [Kineosporia sp. A_224]
MGRRRADVRREEILRAAAVVVSRNGFARTRAADVAEELGVSTALVFYHFETKERLLSEAFAFAAAADLDRLGRAVQARGTCTQRLRAVLRLYAPAGEAPGWTLDIDAWSEALRTPEIRAASQEVDRQWRAAIEQVVRDGVEAGEFSCEDPAASALRIAAMLDGLAVATQVRVSVRRAQAARWAAESAAREVGLPPEVLLLRGGRRPVG